jgi:hypothetical protein
MAIFTDNAVKQLSDGNSQGTVLGQNAADLVGFHGVTPVAQRSKNAQLPIARGATGGMLGQYLTTSITATGCANVTTVEKALAMTGIEVGDTVIVNNPGVTGGIGNGNARVSAANSVGMTLINPTAATATPQASQSYSIVCFKGFTGAGGSAGTVTLSPAAIAPATVIEQTYSVTGVRAGELIIVNKPTCNVGVDIVGMRAVSEGVLGLTWANPTAATVTPTASEAYTVISVPGIQPQSSIRQEVVVASLSAVTNVHADEQALTLADVVATDICLAVSKATAQAGLGVVGARVSTTSTIGVVLMNPTSATITPTASDSYTVVLSGEKPTGLLKLYSPTLTPVAVAANVCAEQTFTVTGLKASTSVWVNKPTFTAGIGIAGVRISSANTLAINYYNGTAASITPPAETYLVGNFQQLPPAAGGSILQKCMETEVLSDSLLNEIQAVLAAKGLMKGS